MQLPILLGWPRNRDKQGDYASSVGKRWRWAETKREKGQEEEARGRERQGTYRTVQNRTVRKVKNGKEQRKQEEG
jgi:hypothetical protein